MPREIFVRTQFIRQQDLASCGGIDPDQASRGIGNHNEAIGIDERIERLAEKTTRRKNDLPSSLRIDLDDQTAIVVVDGAVEVVSEGHWKRLTP